MRLLCIGGPVAARAGGRPELVLQRVSTKGHPHGARGRRGHGDLRVGAVDGQELTLALRQYLIAIDVTLCLGPCFILLFLLVH